MAASKRNETNGNVDLYDKLIATNPKIERKGAANPYTSLNGNMFTLLASILVGHPASGR
jgi:hypothetical protein